MTGQQSLRLLVAVPVTVLAVGEIITEPAPEQMPFIVTISCTSTSQGCL